MPTKLHVLMFTDQVGSTAQTTQRTHDEIAQVTQAHAALTATAVSQCHGAVLKDTGDGVMATFASCVEALRCGALLQQRLAAWNAAQSNARLCFALHIGIDSGDVEVLPNGDVRGTAANRAARVCAECPAGEVYCTDRVAQELHPREAQMAEVGPLTLKGLPEPVRIYRLVAWLDRSDQAPNPFVWRDGMSTAEDFWNRDQEQRTLRAYLRAHQNCQIVGPRRIGKTSLLLHLARVAPTWDSTLQVVYLDLLDARCHTLAGWLRQVSRRYGWATPPTDLASFSEQVEAMRDTGQHPVLCLDELEQLTTRRAEFTKKRREAPSFTAGRDRRWARRARCPSDQSDPGGSRALNGRGEHGSGSPVL